MGNGEGRMENGEGRMENGEGRMEEFLIVNYFADFGIKRSLYNFFIIFNNGIA